MVEVDTIYVEVVMAEEGIEIWIPIITGSKDILIDFFSPEWLNIRRESLAH